MGRASVPTPALYPAFFFVLGKAAKGVGNAVIPTFPAHCPHGLQHLRYKRPMFAFVGESGYTRHPSPEPRTQRLTRRNRGLPFCEHSVALRCQRNPFYSTVLLYTYISRFSVNPLSAEEKKSDKASAINFISQPLFIPFFNFSHKRPTFAFTSKSGYTLTFANRIAHSGLHGETGAIQMGALLLPSDCFTRFGNPAWPGGRTANFAAFGSWSEALLKDTESLRNSDALMRVAVPRRRGPAGLRDLFAIW